MHTYSHSEQLRSKIGLVFQELAGAVDELLNHPSLAAIYPEYLFALYSMTRATVPVMEEALAKAQALAETDQVAAPLARYLEKHIPEEQHSHWLLEDLEALDFERSAVLARLPSPGVAALIGSQYYWIHYVHPVALLGYMELAEGYPPTDEWVGRLQARTGYPREAFRSLERHAYVDLAHRDELHAVLDALPLTASQVAVIGLNAIQSVHLGAKVLRDLLH